MEDRGAEVRRGRRDRGTQGLKDTRIEGWKHTRTRGSDGDARTQGGYEGMWMT